MWFDIKLQPSCAKGAIHVLVYQTIKKSRYLSEEMLRVIDPVLQRNAYFRHHEHMLLAMLFDSRQHVRMLAIHRIRKARAIKY